MNKKLLIGIPAFVLIAVMCFSCQGYAVRKSRIERITGCTFPDYKIVKSNSGLMSFLGDYSDSFIAEFESIPTPDFYIQLESDIDAKHDHNNGYKSIFWTSNINGQDTIYSFHSMWGNGLPAPNGESENADGFLNIKIRKGDKVFEITEGRW